MFKSAKAFAPVLIVLAVLVIWFYSSQLGNSKDQAIALIKSQHPELNNYPSDNLPPTSIKTEMSMDGWYVAFIQQGSGVPIISAQCFLVNNNKEITKTGQFQNSGENKSAISARDCK